MASRFRAGVVLHLALASLLAGSAPRIESAPAGPPADVSTLCELPAGLEPVLTNTPGSIIGGGETARKEFVGGQVRILTWTFAVNADARSTAILARRGTRQVIVLDCVPGPDHDEIKGIAFSPNGARLAYGAKEGGHWRVVVDGKPGDAWDNIHSPTFSPDSQRLAYLGQRAGLWHQVVDGEAGPGMDSMYVASFLKNGYAYLAKRRGKWVVMPSGEGPEWDAVAFPTVAGDGGKFAFVARAGVEPWRVVDGKSQGPLFKELTQPVFSPDGARVAYRAQAAQNVPYDSKFDPVQGSTVRERSTLFGQPGRMPPWVMVVDGQLRAINLILAGPKFNADGSLLAYASGSNFDSVVYLNHERVLELKSGGRGEFFLWDVGFSPTGRQLWIGMSQLSVGHPFVPGHKVLRRYDIQIDSATGRAVLLNPRDEPQVSLEVAIFPVVFSPDGHRMAYVVKDRQYEPYAVLDGRPGASYEEILNRLSFTEGALTYVARKGRALLRVTQR